MTVTIRKDKIVFELPRKDFEPLDPGTIKREVENELRKRVAVKRYARGEISEEELMNIVGPEVALDIIEARKVTERAIRRALGEKKTNL